MFARFKSQAFRDGFALGFSAPFRFLGESRHPIEIPGEDLVQRAWQEVGDTIRGSMSTAGVDYGKSSVKAKSRRPSDKRAA